MGVASRSHAWEASFFSEKHATRSWAEKKDGGNVTVIV